MTDQARVRRMTSDIARSARKMKKMIFAIEAAPAAMPPKPNIAAITAMMKNTNAKRAITNIFIVN